MKLESTFRHRSFWLGCAMLIIIPYHSRLTMNSYLFSLVRQYGYAGVDFFIFASGIGCYFSLEKDPDILRFLQRRLRKLGPVYLCFIIPWIIWKSCTGSFPTAAVLGNLLGLQTFISRDYHFNWYISALILFYILLPYIKRVTDSNRNWISDIFIILFFFAIALSFWNEQCWHMVILSRLPILSLGVIYGKLGKRGALLTKTSIFLHFLAFGAGCVLLYFTRDTIFANLWYRGFFWYPFLFIVPGTCLFLSGIGTLFLRIKALKPVYLLLEKMGIYSFELYLVHLFLFEQLVPGWIPNFPNVPDNLLWLMALCSVFPLSFLLNRTATLFTLLLRKKTHFQ